jgi:hypothetical protein
LEAMAHDHGAGNGRVPLRAVRPGRAHRLLRRSGGRALRLLPSRRGRYSLRQARGPRIPLPRLHGPVAAGGGGHRRRRRPPGDRGRRPRDADDEGRGRAPPGRR